MTENNEPSLADVMETTEHATPDHHEHGKSPARVNDDDLARRTELERVAAGVDDYDLTDVPAATE
jgi:hypothetical protein